MRGSEGGGGGCRGPTARKQSGQRFLVLNYFTVFRWDPIFSRMGGGGGGGGAGATSSRGGSKCFL